MSSFQQYPGGYPAQPQMPNQPQYPQQVQGFPPQGYPQQQVQGYPQQQPQGYPQQPQGYPPQAPMGFQPQMLGQMPPSHQIDDRAAEASFAANQANAGSGRGQLPNFLKVPGPAGQTKWDASVFIGYEGKLRIRLLPPWAAGKGAWAEVRSYFFRSPSHPKGKVLLYQGEDSLFTSAVRLALQSPDPRLQKLAQDVGRVRRQFLYNVADVGNPATHYGQDGIMKPFVLAAGPQLQADIGRLANVRGGISKLVHVEQGRDVILSKKKTGPEERNVEWGMLDMDPGPLAQPLWPLLQNLWDLDSLNKAPTPEEVMTAIRELGLPMPAMGGSFGQVPQSYNPNPAPPYGSPYQGAPMAPAPMGQPQMMGPPQGMGVQGGPYQQQLQYPPPGPQVQQMPPSPQQGAPSVTMSWGPSMPPAPPPVSSQPGPMQPYQGPQQGMAPPPPPPMNPPPVSSQPGPSGYVQNPGGTPQAQPPQMPRGPNGVPF